MRATAAPRGARRASARCPAANHRPADGRTRRARGWRRARGPATHPHGLAAAEDTRGPPRNDRSADTRQLARIEAPVASQKATTGVVAASRRPSTRQPKPRRVRGSPAHRGHGQTAQSHRPNRCRPRSGGNRPASPAESEPGRPPRRARGGQHRSRDPPTACAHAQWNRPWTVLPPPPHESQARDACNSRNSRQQAMTTWSTRRYRGVAHLERGFNAWRRASLGVHRRRRGVARTQPAVGAAPTRGPLCLSPPTTSRRPRSLGPPDRQRQR